jgi:MFS family permease
MTANGSGTGVGTTPPRAGLVLGSLILVAAVANLPLAVANVALPDIGLHFNASQTQLNLVAVCYSLGLACSVLWFGAVGDRYGRKQMLLIGVVVSAVACPVMAWAPSINVLIGARFVGGMAAGMAYPTTLSLITALWSDPGRTRCIALWSASGGAIAALGPLAAGLLLTRFWWGSVFLITLPLILIALPMTMRFVPSHVNETSDDVDHLGGVLSALLIGAVILGINFAVVPNSGTLVISLAVIAVAAVISFLLRERRTPNPLYDLQVAGRRVFWVAACAGIIVFGSLMGAMFVGQQYLQNVLGYSTLDAGLAILPAAVLMVLIAPRSAKLVQSHGARTTLLVGDAFILLGFLDMLFLWKDGQGYWAIGLGYACIGIGVGFAGTPASHSLTGSVPVTRVGMASGTADLQRDLGGAVLQSIMGALLTAGYAAAATKAIAGSPQSSQVSASVQSELTKSFDGAEDIAKQYPQYSKQIIDSARESFTHGQHWAYAAGAIAVLVGATLVFLFFPRHADEQRLLEEYRATDAQRPDVQALANQAAPTAGAERSVSI